MAFIELPKQYNYDFISPNKKPTSPVTIDWNNSYTKELSALCTFQANDSVARESISKINGTLHTSAPGWGVNSTGVMWESSGSGNFTPWGITFDSTKTNEFLGASGESGFNVVIVGRFNSIGGSTALANLVGDDGDDGLSINVDGTVSWVSGASRLTTTNSLSSGDYFTIVAGYKYNDASTYINLNGVTTTGSPGGFSITGKLEYLCGRSGQNVCKAELNLFYIVDTLFSVEQAERLAKNPYQILKPTTSFLLPVSVGGGITIGVGTLSDIASVLNPEVILAQIVEPSSLSDTAQVLNPEVLLTQIIEPSSISDIAQALNPEVVQAVLVEAGVVSDTASANSVDISFGVASILPTLVKDLASVRPPVVSYAGAVTQAFYSNEDMIKLFRQTTGLNSYNFNELAIAYYKQVASSNKEQFNETLKAAQDIEGFVGLSPNDWRNFV